MSFLHGRFVQREAFPPNGFDDGQRRHHTQLRGLEVFNGLQNCICFWFVFIRMRARGEIAFGICGSDQFANRVDIRRRWPGLGSQTSHQAGSCCDIQCRAPSPQMKSVQWMPVTVRSGKHSASVFSAMRSFGSLNVGTSTKSFAI